MKVSETIYLKNMLSQSSIRLIDLVFSDREGVCACKISLGEVRVEFDDTVISRDEVIGMFQELGFDMVHDQNQEIVERIKAAAIELIFKAFNTNSLIRNSDYISEKLQLPYEKISRIFSQVTGMRLEKYIISLKIEKAKEMLSNGDYTISEIAYMMNYSSVQYFSNQFKKTVGVTVSQFRESPQRYRIPLENLV